MPYYASVAELHPREYRRYSRLGNFAAVGAGSAALAGMAYFDLPTKWMVVAAFAFLGFTVSMTIREAALWLESRRR